MTSTIGSVFLDTNVFVYACDAADPSKRDRARDVILHTPHITISSQVLAEFYHVTTRKLASPLPPDRAADVLAEMSQLEVVPHDAALVRGAAALSRSAGLSLWDAMIVRAAATAGCDVLLTEDLAHASTLDGVRIENPFAGV